MPAGALAPAGAFVRPLLPLTPLVAPPGRVPPLCPPALPTCGSLPDPRRPLRFTAGGVRSDHAIAGAVTSLGPADLLWARQAKLVRSQDCHAQHMITAEPCLDLVFIIALKSSGPHLAAARTAAKPPPTAPVKLSAVAANPTPEPEGAAWPLAAPAEAAPDVGRRTAPGDARSLVDSCCAAAAALASRRGSTSCACCCAWGRLGEAATLAGRGRCACALMAQYGCGWDPGLTGILWAEEEELGR